MKEIKLPWAWKSSTKTDAMNIHRARLKLQSRVALIIKQKKLTQEKAGKVLHICQSKISSMKHGNTSVSFSHLFWYLNMLDHDVEIIIKPKTLPSATTSVVIASE